MDEVLKTPQHGVTAASAAPPAWPAETSGDLEPAALMLEMASPAALLAVLSAVARLGGRITQVYATERQADLRVLVPRRLAHRLLPCLGQLIEVLAVREAPAGPSASRGRSASS